MSKSKSGKQSRQGSPATRERKRQEKAQRQQRRRRNRLIRAGAVGALVVLVGGSALFAYSRGEDRVRDLSQVGRGVPAVIQVHDTTCPVCTELRANVERIDDEFSDDELLIRIADVHTDDGVEFAARYTTARRATLLFIDGSGELIDVQTGAQEVADLRRAFERHAAGDLAGGL